LDAEASAKAGAEELGVDKQMFKGGGFGEVVEVRAMASRRAWAQRGG
jgi:hypothetical protein